jgi:2-isopropylmalate synthase
MSHIQLYDATLRDGMGGGGMSLTAREKVRVVQALDALGVHMIEAGFPASNPKELAFFELLAEQPPTLSEIVAFGMTRRRDSAADADDGLLVLAESFAPICTLVGKSSPLHVEKVVRVSREENLAMIGESIAFLHARGKRVLFDAEHFFDGFELDSGYALDTLRAAAGAGAERVVLCDTNGGTLPARVHAVVEAVRAELPDVALGIHTHDDGGCAVANTLLAVQAGATQVQGTINGIGERTGNANLVTILADLQLKMGYDVLPPERLMRLTETAHLVDELLNRPPHASQPYVGKHAFAHKAGLHAAGVRSDANTFEHVDPEVVGNSRDLLISELSGKGAVVEKARSAGIEADEEFVARVLSRVKELEHEGFQFEAADGSFELLMRREQDRYESLFRLESWRVTVEKHADGNVETEASIRVWKDGRRYWAAAEGNGPVNALDKALRKAIGDLYPALSNIELVNFKVRILDELKGTGAVTRVLIDASDGHDVWGSIGVSENVIGASWDALLDSLEYGLSHRHGEGSQAAAAADSTADGVAGTGAPAAAPGSSR